MDVLSKKKYDRRWQEWRQKCTPIDLIVEKENHSALFLLSLSKGVITQAEPELYSQEPKQLASCSRPEHSYFWTVSVGDHHRLHIHPTQNLQEVADDVNYFALRTDGKVVAGSEADGCVRYAPASYGFGVPRSSKPTSRLIFAQTATTSARISCVWSRWPDCPIVEPPIICIFNGYRRVAAGVRPIQPWNDAAETLFNLSSIVE